MGTRSLTIVYKTEPYNVYVLSKDPEPIVNIYRQYDGYPSGHGLELAKILTSPDGSNGIECMAASIVAGLKTKPYNVYLYSIDTRECGQDYEYHVYENSVKVIDMNQPSRSMFEGSWEDFKRFCELNTQGVSYDSVRAA